MSVMSTPSDPLPNHSNPFASRYVRPGALAFRFDSGLPNQAAVTTTSIVSRLHEVRCGAIIGDHGTGKSTLLRELAEQLERELPGGQWVQLTQEPTSGILSRIVTSRVVLRLQNRVARGGVLVIDGGEQLPVIARWWIMARARRRGHFCLLTSHRELAGFTTLYRTSLTPALIADLLDELLPPSDDPQRSRLREKLQRHAESIDWRTINNLRDLWDDLYEVAARLGC